MKDKTFSDIMVKHTSIKDFMMVTYSPGREKEWVGQSRTPLRTKVRRFKKLEKRGGASVGKKGSASTVVRRMKLGRDVGRKGGQVNVLPKSVPYRCEEGGR